MPMIQCSRSVAADKRDIWHFVSKMDNWAPFIMGYQGHVTIDDKRSNWTVKGDVGPLARTVSLEVIIDEWVEPDRVVFTLTGLTEAVEGGGGFYVGGLPVVAHTALPEGATSRGRRKGRRSSWWRGFVGMLHRRVALQTPNDRHPRGGGAEATQPAQVTMLTFELTLNARGMMGPVVNAMLEPLMDRAANDLADKLESAIVSARPL
jgi:carbon monoxide dehydrogenase subunit G